MLVNSVSYTPSLYTKKTYNNSEVKYNSVDKVAFTGGVKPEVLKNQLRVFLTQDIWSPKLKVKMPETPMEKEVLVEVLEKRALLDRYVRLSNKKIDLKGTLNRFKMLSQKDPLSPELPQLKTEIEKQGDLELLFNTLDKGIEKEAKKYKVALDYFKNIEKVEKEYLDKKLVKVSAMGKFWDKVNKNNINADGKLSVRELIDIVSNDTQPVSSKAAKKVVKPLTKKEFAIDFEKQYERLLQENIDIYDLERNYNADAFLSRKTITIENADKMKTFSDIKFNKIYGVVESRYMHKMKKINDSNLELFPIGEIYKDLKNLEPAIKVLEPEISALKQQLVEKPTSRKIKQELSKQEETLNKIKKAWIVAVKYAIGYEKQNCKRLVEAGLESEYTYLTKYNKTLNRYKNAIEILKNNNGSIPENMWKEVLP